MYAPATPFRTILAQLRGDRRGVTSVAFAGTAMVVVGSVALATDASLMYSSRRGAQAAADTAALAGTVTLSRLDAASARGAALDVSGRNGFAHGGVTTVSVSIPPSGRHALTPGAVEVVVRQPQTLSFGKLLTNVQPVVQTRAIAALADDRPACMLALTGSFSFGGGGRLTAADCALASNRPSGPGFDISGGVVTAHSLSSVGSCAGCTGDNVRLTDRYNEYQPPARNPFAALDQKALPRFSGGTCLPAPARSATLAPYESNGGRAYCSDIRVNAGDTLRLRPGTHYLNNASLIVLGSGSVVCQGCTGGEGVTLVLTGDPARIGTVQFGGGGQVTLRAPSSPADPDFRGVLIYRDARASTATTARFGGGTDSVFAGGIYLPGAEAQFNGGTGSDSCGIVVAASFSFSGTANVISGASRCAEFGTPVPRTTVARLLE